MKLKRHVYTGMILAALFCMGGPCPANSPNGLVYETTLRSRLFGNMGLRKMYIKGSSFVWEASSAGLKAKLVKNKDGAFLLHPTGRYAAKYPPGSNRESPMVCLPGPDGNVANFLVRNKARKIGGGKIGKRVCDTYTYTEHLTRWKCKLWIDRKTLTPARLLMIGGKKSDTIIATYLSYKTGIDLPDSLFSLPKGVEIRPMPVRNRTGAYAPKLAREQRKSG